MIEVFNVVLYVLEIMATLFVVLLGNLASLFVIPGVLLYVL